MPASEVPPPSPVSLVTPAPVVTKHRRPAADSGSGSSELSAASADLAQFSKMVNSYAAQQPVSGVSGLKGKSVWYIPIGNTVPILAAFGIGMQAALAKAGITTHICDGKFLPTNAAACISQAETDGASGVVTGYIDYASMPTSFNSLVAHHIPVLVAAEAPDGGKTSSPQLAFFHTITTIDLMQKLDMDAVIADSKGKANVLYLGVTDSPQTLDAANYGSATVWPSSSTCATTSASPRSPSAAARGSSRAAGYSATADGSRMPSAAPAWSPRSPSRNLVRNRTRVA